MPILLACAQRLLPVPATLALSDRSGNNGIWFEPMDARLIKATLAVVDRHCLTDVAAVVAVAVGAIALAVRARMVRPSAEPWLKGWGCCGLAAVVERWRYAIAALQAGANVLTGRKRQSAPSPRDGPSSSPVRTAPSRRRLALSCPSGLAGCADLRVFAHEDCHARAIGASLADPSVQ
jgi:hypothetical protein